MKKVLLVLTIVLGVLIFTACDILFGGFLFVETGTVTGYVIDATTGDGIANVRVESGDEVEYTNSSGYFEITVETGTQTITFSLNNYYISSYTVSVEADETTYVPSSAIMASPTISGSNTWRVVLTWGSSPSDLDSHLWTPNDEYHIYYSNKSPAGSTAILDVDDTSSYGPETITIDPVSTTGTYTYYVYNFSGTPDITSSSATVRLYNSSGLYRTYTVPTSGSGRYWHVFDIVNGSIVTRNVIQSTQP